MRAGDTRDRSVFLSKETFSNNRNDSDPGWLQRTFRFSSGCQMPGKLGFAERAPKKHLSQLKMPISRPSARPRESEFPGLDQKIFSLNPRQSAPEAQAGLGGLESLSLRSIYIRKWQSWQGLRDALVQPLILQVRE